MCRVWYLVCDDCSRVTLSQAEPGSAMLTSKFGGKIVWSEKQIC